jgi:uncharacterized protein YndB with AHSA1/START domain
MNLQHVPVAKAQMLIRRPVAEVFEAFVDPAVTTKFWFTRSSGRLEAGKEAQWDWEMYGVSSQVKVKDIERNKRILIVWSGDPNPTSVEWVFTSRPDNTTFVSISNSGFAGNGDEVVAKR